MDSSQFCPDFKLIIYNIIFLEIITSLCPCLPVFISYMILNIITTRPYSYFCCIAFMYYTDTDLVTKLVSYAHHPAMSQLALLLWQSQCIKLKCVNLSCNEWPDLVVMWCHVMSCDFMSCHVMWFHILNII